MQEAKKRKPPHESKTVQKTETSGGVLLTVEGPLSLEAMKVWTEFQRRWNGWR